MDSVLQAGRTGLLILSFWGDLFILYRFVRIRSWFVPAVCMAGTGLILYWGVLADVLPQTADLLLACGLAGFFCFLAYSVRGKVRLSRPDLFHLCFFIGAAVFAGLSLTMRLTHYDNFSHWAVIVKYLLGADRLPGADAAIDAFRDYPPGSSFLIYYVCRYAGHSQGIMLSYLNMTVRINNLLVDFLLPLMALASAAAGYYAGMLYMYLHAMPADEALRLAGFKRYACSAAVLYAGFLIMGAAVDIEHSFAVGINFLYSEYSGLLRIRDGYEESLPAQAERAVGDRWYEGAETDGRPYRISVPGRESQAAEGELRYIYRYFLWAEDVEICD